VVSGTPPYYYFADHLQSARVIVQAGQNTACYEADFEPYGLEHDAITPTCTQNYKFTGKERDSESGLDYFGARYNSSRLGRFMSPDPVTMLPERLRDPQQLNLYAYSRNNPLRFIDPTGTTIDDSACLANKYCKKWMEIFLKSKEGQALWKKLDEDKKLLVKLQWDKKATTSVTGDYKWDAGGKLTEATVTLAPRTGDVSYHMNPTDYAFGSTITDTGERQVYVFGHELAHVEDAGTSQGRQSVQEIERLYPAAKARYDEEGYTGYANDRELQSTFAIIRADNKRNENVADKRAQGIVESYRCQGKECQK
jgi:RHS repeat-associated protein